VVDLGFASVPVAGGRWVWAMTAAQTGAAAGVVACGCGAGETSRQARTA